MRTTLKTALPTLAQATLTDDERRVLEHLLPRLREQLNPEAVWLYGSRARGEDVDFDESDVDLLVIAAGDMRANSARVDDLLRAAAQAAGVPGMWFSIHVWDPEWLDHRREIRSFFIQEVERDKIVLHPAR